MRRFFCEAAPLAQDPAASSMGLLLLRDPPPPTAPPGARGTQGVGGSAGGRGGRAAGERRGRGAPLRERFAHGEAATHSTRTARMANGRYAVPGKRVSPAVAVFSFPPQRKIRRGLVLTSGWTLSFMFVGHRRILRRQQTFAQIWTRC
jgi:hypothetical protein